MSSYRQQLLDGKMPDWDLKLRKCVFDIRSVVAEIMIRTKREASLPIMRLRTEAWW